MSESKPQKMTLISESKNDDIVARNQAPEPPMAAAAPPPRRWDELPPQLVPCVLRTMTSYVAARGACTAWRSGLPPPPASLFLLVAGSLSTSAYSLQLQRSFGLSKLHTGYRYVGAGHGWLAVTYRSGSSYETAAAQRKIECGGRRDKDYYYYRNFEGEEVQLRPHEMPEVRHPDREKRRISLLNPVTGKHVVLPEHAALDPHDVTKVAFAPNPRPDDFTAVVAYGTSGLAYISSTRDGGEWCFGEIPDAITDVVYRDDDDRVYCLTRRGDVHVLHVPRGRQTIKLLLPELSVADSGGFDPAAAFPPPHARLADLITGTGGKTLVFCGGDMYQVWRNNTGGAINLNLQGGGRFAVPKDEVLVLRHDPARRPCWVAAADLKGHAVFVGPASSAVAVRPEDVPGIKGDCVYSVGQRGDGPAIVFHVKTGQRARCVAPSANVSGEPVCWLTLGEAIEQQ